MESFQAIDLPYPTFSSSDLTHVVREKLRHIIKVLLYSSIYVGLAGSWITYVAAILQGIEPSLASMVITFCVIFSVYNLNRKTDEAEDVINRSDRFAFTQRYAKYLFGAAIIAYGIAFTIASLAGPIAMLVTAIPLIAGVFYSVPFLPKSVQYRRLKEVPVAKNIIVSLSWALTLTLLPFTLAHHPYGLKTWVALSFFLTWAIVASILPDIRDREGDARTGIRTIPVLIGEEATLTFLTVFIIICGIAAIVGSVLILSSMFVLLVAFSICYLAVCIRSFTSPRYRDLICDIITDGQFIFIGGGIALLTYVARLW